MNNVVSNETNRTARVEDYGNILEALRSLSVPTHIAGGAVRDTILGVQIRDIDIFIGASHSDAAAALLRSTFHYVKVGQWRQYHGFSDPMVSCVAKFERADATIPICLIGLVRELTAWENISRFDFGICMAFWAGGTSPLFTDDLFKRDAEGRTFTLCRADDYQQFVYSMSRYKKLAADRYRGWELSVPEQFEGLLKEYTFRQNWYRDDGAHFGLGGDSTQMLRPKQR